MPVCEATTAATGPEAAAYDGTGSRVSDSASSAASKEAAAFRLSPLFP